MRPSILPQVVTYVKDTLVCRPHRVVVEDTSRLMNAVSKGHADYAYLRMKNKDAEDRVVVVLVGMKEPGMHDK